MSKTKELSIIIPTLNEIGKVPELIRVLKKELASVPFELIFVDDDSSDLTWKYIQDLNEENITVIRRIGRNGLASAVVEGFGIAAGTYFLVMDADFQHDAGIILPMLRKAKEGFALVVGSRYTDGGNTGQWSPFRKFVSAVATKLARIFTKVDVADSFW